MAELKLNLTEEIFKGILRNLKCKDCINYNKHGFCIRALEVFGTELYTEPESGCVMFSTDIRIKDC